MIDLGTVRPGSTIYIPWATFAGSTGAPSAMTGLAVGDIKIYKDGGTTERASTNGYTLLDTDGQDFDALTGINGISINLADNSTAGFYASGSRYFVVISDVTIDSQTVRFVAATFDIGIPGAVLNTTVNTLSTQTSFTLTSGPAEDDALNGCILYIHDVASAVQGGFAAVSDYTGASKTVTLLAGTTFTVAATDNIHVMPPSNVHYWLANIVATPTVAGVPEVDVTHFNGTAGTFASGRPEVNTTHAAGTAWGSGAITAASIAADAITAAKIATGAIDADALAADAVDEIVDGVWDEVLTGATHNVTNSAGRRLRLIDAAFEVHSGTAQSGSTSTTFVMDTGASAVDDIYNGDRIVVTGGTGAEEHGLIIDYVGSTRTATMSKAWVVTPDNTSEFAVIPADTDVETWNHLAVVALPLTPTVAGRTLDVSAGGEAGVDWANVGSPTSAQALSNTTISSVSGSVGSVAGSVSGNVDGSVGSVTGNVGGNVTGSVGSVGAGGITASSLAADAITAAKVAADVSAEIADQVWDEVLAGHLTAGTTGEALSNAGAAGDPWSTALPGAYGAGTAGKIVGDNINATISSRASQTSLDTLDDYVDTEIAAIKTQTDKLTFTVANQIDANIQYVNDVQVTGNGQSGTEWGP